MLPLPLLRNFSACANFSCVGGAPDGHSPVQLVLHLLLRDELRPPLRDRTGQADGELTLTLTLSSP